MALSGYTEEELLVEMENCEATEAVYDDGLRKVKEAIEHNTLYTKQAKLLGNAESWLAHSNPAANTFTTQGSERIEKLGMLESQLRAHSHHDFFSAALNKAEPLLKKMRQVVNAAAPLPAATAVTPAYHIRNPAPYKVDTPTFSGKAMEFPQFLERFTSLMK